MPQKITRYTRPEVDALLAKALAADGKAVTGVRWEPCESVSVEYDLIATAADTAQTLNLMAVMVEKAATIMEQCQIAGIDFSNDVLAPATQQFLKRAEKADRLSPEDLAPVR